MATTCTRAARTTRSLLGYGMLAGPVYVVVSLAQALARDGFDLSRHAWSLLANGDWGWIQVTNLIVVGGMTITAAYGLRRALAPGRARTWAPALLGGYGASVIGAGAFRADPAAGFPPGAPETAEVTWHGMLHLLVGGVGFLALIAAGFVLGGRFAAGGHRGLAWFSRITGMGFLAGFAGIATGSGPATLGFVAAVLVVWAWLVVVCLHYYRATTDR